MRGGPLPPRVTLPFDLKIEEETDLPKLVRKKITTVAEGTDRLRSKHDGKRRAPTLRLR